MIVGLTGGIGSGKTAVSDSFEALGIDIVDADLASRVVVQKGKPCLAQIQEHFGDDILNEDGMRFHNEFVKHKVLDIVGDLYLLGGNLIGHYEGYKTGHMLNDQLLSAILSQPKAFTIETFEEKDSPIHYYSEDWQNTL